MKKKLLTLMLATVLAFSVVACGDDSSDSKQESEAKPDTYSVESAIKVAMSTPEVVENGGSPSSLTDADIVTAFDGYPACKAEIEDALGCKLSTLSGYRVTIDGLNVKVTN